MFSREDPITLQAVQAPAPPREAELTPEQILHQRNIRDGCLSALQDRAYSLPVRLMRLGAGLRGAAPLEGSGDEEAQRQAALRALAEFSPADIPPADPGRAFALQQKLVRVLALDQPSVQAEADAALCAAYALVRFLAVGCTVQRHDVTQLVDVCAAAFRFIAHTAFSWNAPIVLGPDGMPPALWVLVQN